MSEGNQLFWKAYASSIKDIMVSGPVGKKTRVYIAANNTAGISAGVDIPPECTNWGIFQYADFMLDPENPNWVASKTSRYSDAIDQTLQNLTPGRKGDTSPDAKDRLSKAKKKLALDKEAKDKAYDEAMEDFTRDDNPEKAAFFAQWAPLNANAYVVADRNWQATANKVQEAYEAIDGPGSALLGNVKNQVASGTNKMVEVKGFNMKASTKSVTYDAAGEPIIPKPLDTQFVPQYSLQGYAALLDGWVAHTNQEPSTFQVNLSAGRDSSYKDLGFTDAQGDASFSRFPVFEFYARGNKKIEQSNFNMKSNSSDVSVTIKIKHYKTLAFQPGNWDVDVNSLITKLEAKAPPMSEKVRPTQILVARGVSMEIKFAGDAKTAFDKDYKKTVQGGGGIKILGLKIGATGSSKEENAVHRNDWDSGSGVLTIHADDARGSANVLAVMGEVVTV